MDADEIARAAEKFSASEVIGRVEVLEREDRVRACRYGLRLSCVSLRLDGAILEHRLDHEVWQSASASRNRASPRYAASSASRSASLGAALRDPGPVDQLCASVPCPCRRLPGRCRPAPRRCRRARRDIGDARTHEAGADHADLLRRQSAARLAGRRAPLFSSPIETNKVRIIAAASGERSILAKPAALDLQRQVQRQLQAFIDACCRMALDRPDNCRRSRAGRWRWPAGHTIMPCARERRGPPGGLKPSDRPRVPRPCRRRCLHPGLRLGDDLGGRRHFVDEAHASWPARDCSCSPLTSICRASPVCIRRARPRAVPPAPGTGRPSLSGRPTPGLGVVGGPTR